MRIVGIIAEYNPFHQGHAYQIKKSPGTDSGRLHPSVHER